MTASAVRRAATLAAALTGALVLALTVGLVVLLAVTRQAAQPGQWIPVELAAALAAVGLVVARRQPANPVGWLLVVTAVGVLGTSVTSMYALLAYRQGHPGLPLAATALVIEALTGALAQVLLPVAVLLFPDGRLPSRRWRPVLIAFAALALFYLAVLTQRAVGAVTAAPIRVDSDGGLLALDGHPSAGWQAVLTSVSQVGYVLFWLAVVGRQVSAWRRAGGERRQQLKWLMTGAAVAGVALIGFAVVDGLPGAANSAPIQAADNVFGLMVAALPAGIGVGILKYRLYEIDRIISRTLAYTLVTGLLVGVYVGVVLLTTEVLRFSSPIAVAASTLIAAALFTPLRRRVQRTVDRRFNRARYDADAAAEAFAARLAGAVTLPQVQTELQAVVSRTLEPAHVSIWLPTRQP
ncbi:MAG: hypothetical protein JO016_06475 [Actinobacteria bacterium]|nr:hypothetical protein [Actinomycetota bacterium]